MSNEFELRRDYLGRNAVLFKNVSVTVPGEVAEEKYLEISIAVETHAEAEAAPKIRIPITHHLISMEAALRVGREQFPEHLFRGQVEKAGKLCDVDALAAGMGAAVETRAAGQRGEQAVQHFGEDGVGGHGGRQAGHRQPGNRFERHRG